MGYNVYGKPCMCTYKTVFFNLEKRLMKVSHKTKPTIKRNMLQYISMWTACAHSRYSSVYNHLHVIAIFCKGWKTKQPLTAEIKLCTNGAFWTVGTKNVSTTFGSCFRFYCTLSWDVFISVESLPAQILHIISVTHKQDITMLFLRIHYLTKIILSYEYVLCTVLWRAHNINREST